MHSFDLLLAFAHEKGLYDTNKQEIDYIYLKKAYLLSIFTYIHNGDYPHKTVLFELHQRLLDQIPDYTRNPHYLADYKMRLLHMLIYRMPRIAIHLIPYYIRLTKMKL